MTVMVMVVLMVLMHVVLMVMVMSMPEVRSETAVSFNWQERLS